MARERFIDLNADLGEEITDDAALLQLVSSANVACGYHAGNAEIMRAVCEEAVARGVSIGAQVSYDDRPNFGRVLVEVAGSILRDQVADQVGTLTEIAEAAGGTVRYVKPHGALYHRVLDDPEHAQAVLEGSGELPILGMPGELWSRAAYAGRRVVLEGFPDRGYDARGRLLPRGEPDAVLEDAHEISAQALGMAGRVDSLCLHGDHPGAVDHADLVRRQLTAVGWVLRGI